MRRNYVQDDSIRELDLELELLKRKRQVIQEKRHIMMEEQQFNRIQQHNSPWADPMMSFGNNLNLQYGNNSNKSGNILPLMKRSMDRSAWENAPKRFAGPTKSRNPFGDHVTAETSGSTRIRPNTGVPGTPFTSHHPGTSGKRTHGPRSRVSNTSTMIEDKDLILLPDVEPSDQLVKRLELALGNILKELRESCKGPIHPYGIRMAKLKLRERLRKALSGKFIGNLYVNLDNYWRAFPRHTNTDLVKMMQEGEPTTQPEAKIANEPKYESKYKGTVQFRTRVKTHANRILEAKLDEMFTKLEKLYEEEKRTLKGTDEKQSNIVNNDQEAEKHTSPKEGIYRMTANTLTGTLDTLLPKYKIKIMDMLDIPNIIQSVIYQERQKEKKTAAPAQSDPSNLYIVKILGEPTLPKKSTMTKFLEVFKPSAVKRHRQLLNALYVTLTDEALHAALLAKDGTVLGNSTIKIKKCTLSESNNKQNDKNKDEPLAKKQKVSDENVTKQVSTESPQETKAAETNPKVDDNKIISAIEKGNVDIDDADFNEICGIGNTAEAAKVIEPGSRDGVAIDKENAIKTDDGVIDEEKAIKTDDGGIDEGKENDEDTIDEEKAEAIKTDDGVIDEGKAKDEDTIDEEKAVEAHEDAQKVTDVVNIDDDCEIINVTNEKIVIPDDENEGWLIDDKGDDWEVEPESNGVELVEEIENVDSGLRDDTENSNMETHKAVAKENN